MTSGWLEVSAKAAAFSVFLGLAVRLLTRNRSADSADSTTDHVEKDAGTICSSSDATELVHGTEEMSSSLQRQVLAEPGHEFEVFLSFRGKEIRQTFTDSLYHSLKDVGVRTFRDNEELHVGKEIGPDLMTAITRSKISMPIFTKDYASSKWCLREVAQMVRCMKETGGKHMIMPIFLNVTPDDAQHQSGDYAKLFASHERTYGSEMVKEWRDALTEVTKLKGLELNKAGNGNQGEFIGLVVAEVLRELRQARLDLGEILVGLEDPAEELMQLLEVGVEDIRVVGIWGTGGIGKTTLAKYVYNQIAYQFEGCSFLEGIREMSAHPRGLLELQSTLVSDILGQGKCDLKRTDDGIEVLKNRIRGKKALILLDDVDHINQLKALAADLTWFGSGSRILVTTREKEVLLHQFPGCKIHEVQTLDEDRALKLFCKHAFRHESPSDEFVDLSRKIVKITGGLPLTLEVVGSSLYVNRGKKDVWADIMNQLANEPPTDVQHKLRISYDALTYQHKEIFLDIACFFIGWDCELVTPMWDDCKFFPKLGIEVLCLKSLIKIGRDSKLQMHDQLRDLGRHIVEKENYKEPERRSRLWQKEEAIDVLRGQQGTSKIEAARVWAEEGVAFSAKCFENLSKLRILMLEDGVQLDGNFQHLLPKLRWLRWSTKNTVSPPASLCLNHLIVLCLSSSSVDEEWIGWRSQMGRLKVLDLSSCRRLRRVPDCSTFPNLERLILESCDNLDIIDPSIELLKNLKFLNIRDCRKVRTLPNQLGNLEALGTLIVDSTDIKEIPISIRMKELEVLSANFCLSLKCIPDSVGSLVNLKQLLLEFCFSLTGLPATIGQLNSLVELRLRESGITSLPDTIRNLKQLRVLDVSGCDELEGEVPVDIGNLPPLRVLTLNLTEAQRPPEEISSLSHSHLQKLHLCLGRSWNLQTLPELPSCLISLSVQMSLTGMREDDGREKLDFCEDHMQLKEDFLAKLYKLEELEMRVVNIKTLPQEISFFSRLKKLTIAKCKQLECLPALPPSLCSLEISYCSLRKLPSLSNLRRLSDLYVGFMEIREIEGLRDLTSLHTLSLEGCPSTILDGVDTVVSLHKLAITLCYIEKLPDLSNLQKLEDVDFSGCILLERLPDLSKLQRLKRLRVWGCRKLSQLEGLENLESLEELDMYGCKALENLPDLSKLRKLFDLNLEKCEKLRELDGLGELDSLIRLNLSGCKAIEKLPNISKLQNLRDLSMKEMEKLCQLDCDKKLGSLENFNISGCTTIEKLPDLSNLHNLQKLKMKGCQMLSRLEGLEELKNLEELKISGCQAIERLSDLSKLPRLMKLEVNTWEKPHQVDGLGELNSLEQLFLQRSSSIERLSDLSKLSRLATLGVDDLENLHQFDRLGELRLLTTLVISRCKLIEKLPGLSKLQRLQRLFIISCDKLSRLDEIGELVSLEQLRLWGCKAIEKFPNMSKLRTLQHLDVTYCQKLSGLDGIGELVSLEKLDLSECKEIEKLPNMSKLQTLRHMIMTGCKKLSQHDGIGELVSLEDLDLSGCRSIENLPNLSRLIKLRRVNVGGCEKLSRLDWIGEVRSLWQLDISGCRAIEMLPDLSKLVSLWHLNMRGCEKLSRADELEELESLEELALCRFGSVEYLPDLSKLKRLRWLEVTACKNKQKLEGLRKLGSLEHLAIRTCKTVEKLSDFSGLRTLHRLQVKACENLDQLDGLTELESLRELDLSGSKAIEKLPDLSKHYYLIVVCMRGCKKLRHLDGFGEFTSLANLDISGCIEVVNLPNLTMLPSLKTLKLRACRRLCGLAGLEELNRLKELDISGCKSIEKLPCIARLQRLKVLRMEGCSKLRQIEGIDELDCLKQLRMNGCRAIEDLPNLSKLQMLKRLDMTGCKQLRQVGGLDELRLLEELDISGCNAIKNLPDLAELKQLRKLKVKACKELLNLDGLGELESLEELDISGCKAIEKLPNLSQLRRLRDLRMEACRKLRRLDGLQDLGSLRVLRIKGCRAIEKLPSLSKLQKLHYLDTEACEKLVQIEGLEELKSLRVSRISKGIERQ